MSVLLLKDSGYKGQKYFPSWKNLVFGNLTAQLSTFILFWTLAYDVVHICGRRGDGGRGGALGPAGRGGAIARGLGGGAVWGSMGKEEEEEERSVMRAVVVIG